MASTLECPCIVYFVFECTLDMDDFALYFTRTSFDLLIPVWLLG